MCALCTQDINNTDRPTDRTTETRSLEAVECFVYFGLNYNHPHGVHTVLGSGGAMVLIMALQ